MWRISLLYRNPQSEHLQRESPTPGRSDGEEEKKEDEDECEHERGDAGK